MLNLKNQIIVKDYDCKKYDFYKYFFNLLKIYTENLDLLHQYLPENLRPKEVVTLSNDQNISIYETLYKIDDGYDLKTKRKNSGFLNTFDDFLFSISKDIFKEGVFKKPSFFAKDAKNKLNMLRIPFVSKMISFYKNQNINRIRGCNFSIFKDEIFKVNGFNEEITTWGREDSEFVQRLFNIGVQKQQLKFSGIQYHLYHKERSHNIINDDILNNTINNNISRCLSGIDKYV